MKNSQEKYEGLEDYNYSSITITHTDVINSISYALQGETDSELTQSQHGILEESLVTVVVELLSMGTSVKNINGLVDLAIQSR